MKFKDYKYERPNIEEICKENIPDELKEKFNKLLN